MKLIITALLALILSSCELATDSNHPLCVTQKNSCGRKYYRFEVRTIGGNDCLLRVYSDSAWEVGDTLKLVKK